MPPGLFLTPLLAKLPAEMRQGIAASVPFRHRLSDLAVFARIELMRLTNRSLNAELIWLDNGRSWGSWFTVNNKTHDPACTENHHHGHPQLHHATYATHTREDALRAAGIFLENGVHIETGPQEHAIQGTFFLYPENRGATGSSLPIPVPA